MLARGRTHTPAPAHPLLSLNSCPVRSNSTFVDIAAELFCSTPSLAQLCPSAFLRRLAAVAFAQLCPANLMLQPGPRPLSPSLSFARDLGKCPCGAPNSDFLSIPQTLQPLSGSGSQRHLLGALALASYAAFTVAPLSYV